MLRQVLTAVLVAAGASTLAGCAGDDRSTSAEQAITSQATGPSLPSISSSAPTTTPAAGPSTNAHGNIPKALGEEGGFVAEDGSLSVNFVIDAIDVDPTCTAAYHDYAPENGHLVALRMRVSTGADLSGLEGFAFTDRDFAYIGRDNITQTSVSSVASYACLRNSEQLTQDALGPNQQYVGSIVLDVPSTSGSIVYAPNYLSNASGWEWQF